MESDERFYRRRAREELQAADRAVTQAARKRRIELAQSFLERLDDKEARAVLHDRSFPMTANRRRRPALSERERSLADTA